MDLNGDKFSELCLMLVGGHSLVLKGRREGREILTIPYSYPSRMRKMPLLLI